jgi:homoserine O-acetyltransferase
MDWFDLAEQAEGKQAGGDVLQGLARIGVDKALAIGASTDILFPLQQQQQIADGLRMGGAEAEFLPLESPQGHDAFLVDIERFGPAVANFLAGI